MYLSICLVFIIRKSIEIIIQNPSHHVAFYTVLFSYDFSVTVIILGGIEEKVNWDNSHVQPLFVTDELKLTGFEAFSHSSE